MKKEAHIAQKAILAILTGFLLFSLMTLPLKYSDEPMLSAVYGKECIAWSETDYISIDYEMDITTTGHSDNFYINSKGELVNRQGSTPFEPPEFVLCNNICADRFSDSNAGTYTCNQNKPVIPRCSGSNCIGFSESLHSSTDYSDMDVEILSYSGAPGGGVNAICECSGTLSITCIRAWGCEKETSLQPLDPSKSAQLHGTDTKKKTTTSTK
ncbi:MAG: hypothetical protein ABH864_07145 [archaeon]